MRTTLDIDDDVLRAAKELARVQRTTTGKIISELARTALVRPSHEASPVRDVFELLPGGKLVTVDLVEKLLEEGV